jgi:hypothetical protein
MWPKIDGCAWVKLLVSHIGGSENVVYLNLRPWNSEKLGFFITKILRYPIFRLWNKPVSKWYLRRTSNNAAGGGQTSPNALTVLRCSLVQCTTSQGWHCRTLTLSISEVVDVKTRVPSELSHTAPFSRYWIYIYIYIYICTDVQTRIHRIFWMVFAKFSM